LEPSIQSEFGPEAHASDAALAEGADMASADGERAFPSTAGPTHQEIAAEAYALYTARNYEDGADIEDWLRAEQRLREAGREFGS
jgi:hypothetical protein